MRPLIYRLLTAFCDGCVNHNIFPIVQTIHDSEKDFPSHIEHDSRLQGMKLSVSLTQVAW